MALQKVRGREAAPLIQKSKTINKLEMFSHCAHTDLLVSSL